MEKPYSNQPGLVQTLLTLQYPDLYDLTCKEFKQMEQEFAKKRLDTYDPSDCEAHVYSTIHDFRGMVKLCKQARSRALQEVEEIHKLKTTTDNQDQQDQGSNLHSGDASQTSHHSPLGPGEFGYPVASTKENKTIWTTMKYLLCCKEEPPENCPHVPSDEEQIN